MSPKTTAPAPTSMSAKASSRPNGKPATPWASCRSKPAARHPPQPLSSTTTPASAAFEGSLNDFVAGGGNYYAFFPHAQVTGTTANLPFGNLRTQTGNDFNSAYDALVATPQAYGAADEAGKVDGNPVAFTLHRLTSILDFSIATQADKVKYLLLTAGGETQKLSASSLDFALENGGAETATTLSTTDQSNVIALQYTPDGASADKVEAFFNVPADLYPTLTLDVIGSDNQMATVTVNRTEAFKAGTLSGPVIRSRLSVRRYRPEPRCRRPQNN